MAGVTLTEIEDVFTADGGVLARSKHSPVWRG